MLLARQAVAIWRINEADEERIEKMTLPQVRRVILFTGLLAAVAGCTWWLVAQDATPPGFRAYRLRHINASEVTPQLDKMLSELGGRHEIVVDRTSNRVLVHGSDEIQQLAIQMIETLDQPPTGTPAAAATRLPVVVRGYEVPVAKLDQTLSALQRQYPAETGTRLSVDRRTSQVIVAAPENVQRRVSQQLGTATNASPSKPTGTVQGVVRGYTLQHLSSRELEDALANTWGQRLSRTVGADGEVAIISAVTETGTQPVLHIDRRQNTVAFLGTQESAATWQQAVQTLDRPNDTVESNTQLIPLERADPQQVQQAVDLIQSASRSAARLVSATMAQEEPAAPQPASPPPAAAPAQAPQPAAGQASEGDQPPEQGVTALSDEEDDGGLLGPVQIEYLEGLDVIVLRGHKRDVERVRKIIADIEDVSRISQPAIEVVELQHVGAQVMSELVTEIYDEILSPRQGQVTIRPLVKPNSLLLIGRPESVEIVKSLVAKLDQPVDPETQFELFPLKYISALDAEETIEAFFVDALGQTQQGGQQQGLRPGLGVRVNVVAEYRSNTLIVQASPRDMEEVRRLLQRIDVETTVSSNELKIFRLKNALATDIAPVLQDALNWQLIGNRTPVGASQSGIFGGQGIGGQQDERARLRSAILTFMTIDSDGGKILQSGILAEVRVTADTNGNALLITGPANSMGLIEVLVKELDTLPAARAQIKVFTIVNGDAATLANMLQQLLSEQAQTTQGGRTLFGQGTLNPFLQPGMQTAASLGESTLVPIRFGVDQRTNSIVVTGTEGDLSVVEAILLRLDEESYFEHRTMVYWLANAPAADVAAAVDEWLQDRESIFAEQLQLTPESPDIQWNRRVIVVPEAISNSLIISATPELFDEVKHVVESLDRRRPLIKIDVLIAEVGLGDLYEFGAEFGLQDGLLFDRSYFGGATGPGYNFNNVPLGDDGPNRDLLLGQALSDFALGRISDEGFGGLVLSASKDSISILMRALQADSRVQILSRPTITTLDSQPATVFVGENTARPGGAVQNAATTTTEVNYEDVGLQLLVTPQVTPDGTIVMDIDATKSRLDFNRAIEIDNNRIPNIATINAATTISARSGQTVIFAGLIETTVEQQVRGIPYISDLPVLGPLFSYTREQETRDELLIILTPRIIGEEEELDAIRYAESERMSWCLADVVELYGAVGMSARPGDWCRCGTCDVCRGHAAPVIFPDTNPAGIIQPVIEPQPTPVETFPGPEDSLLQPPINSSSAYPPTTPTGGMANVRQPVYGPVQPGRTMNPYPAVTTGYDGSDSASAAPAAFVPAATGPVETDSKPAAPTAPAAAGARRLPPGPR
jgi:type II secretory pathway component GspD/PulD (secretin)